MDSRRRIVVASIIAALAVGVLMMHGMEVRGAQVLHVMGEHTARATGGASAASTMGHEPGSAGPHGLHFVVGSCLAAGMAAIGVAKLRAPASRTSSQLSRTRARSRSPVLVVTSGVDPPPRMPISLCVSRT